MNRIDFINQNISGKILDVGCNSGSLHQTLIGDIYGIDIVVSKNKHNVIEGDAQNMPFEKDTFDTIVAGELIEHLDDPDMFLNECNRILKDDGKIILSTPNRDSWINRFFKSYFVPAHKNLFNIEELKETIKNHFNIESLFCLPYDLTSSVDSRHKNLFWFRKLIHHLLPICLQEEIILVGRVLK